MRGWGESRLVYARSLSGLQPDLKAHHSPCNAASQGSNAPFSPPSHHHLKVMRAHARFDRPLPLNFLAFHVAALATAATSASCLYPSLA